MSINNNYYSKGFKKERSKKEKVKLTKNDIGLPSNFVHVQHIGWDPQTGFDVRISEDVSSLLSLLSCLLFLPSCFDDH